MLQLHIEAADLNELRLKAMKALLLSEVLPVIRHTAAPAADSSAPVVEPVAADPPAAATDAPPKRGRPRKDKHTPPAAETPAPQAQVGDNSASVPAALDTSTAEGAPATSAAQAAPVDPVSFDQMKAALQSLLDSKLGSADGMAAATRILNDLGYGKVREVKPEHFATVVERVKAVLA